MDSSIRIGGFSGIDTVSLIDQLMQLERQPEVLLQQRQQALGWTKNQWSEVSASLTALQSALKPLLDRNVLLSVAATSSDTSVASAKASPGAVSATYHLTVDQLATATTVATGFTDAPLGLGKAIDPSQAVTGTGSGLWQVVTTGTFTINGKQITVTAGDSLNSLISAINNAGAGVTASYDGVADKLVLTSANPGGPVNLGAAGDTSNFLSVMGLLASPAATDASGNTVRQSTFHLGRINTGMPLSMANFAHAFVDSQTPPQPISGSFKINGVEITFNAATDSLNDVLNRINSSAANVTAIYDGTQDRIILTSKATGSLDISLEDVSGGFLEKTGLLVSGAPGATSSNATVTLGGNAQFRIAELNGGAALYSNGNDVSGIIPNVTLSLQKTGTATISVAKDVKGVEDAINAFVQKYNATMDLINDKMNEKSVPNPTSDQDRQKGLLNNDSVLRDLKSRLVRLVTDLVPGLPAEMNHLAQIGISQDPADFGKSGHLVVDSAKLEAALQNNPLAVADLLYKDANGDGRVDDGDTGVAMQLNGLLDQFISTQTTSVGGVSVKEGAIPRQMDLLDSQISDINDQIARMEDLLNMRQQYLIQEFTAMEQAVTQMQGQMSWLSQQVSKL
ncbi:MAG: flagellar filament capping protein FliD [Firmicutes bacterium]|nr:flagellar filament capping protein FliD [Bacillota bacterium]